jgi:hypothetical protein
VNRAVDTSTTSERAIRGVDDGVDGQRCDVASKDFYHEVVKVFKVLEVLKGFPP